MHGGRTCTQTAGLCSSRTSASWMAPRACSILPSRRNVAEDISQRLLSSLWSRAARCFCFGNVGVDSGGGSDGGGGGASTDERSSWEA